MPRFKSIELTKDLFLGLWWITETKDELLHQAMLTKDEYAHFQRLKAPWRQKEWLSVRALINEIMGKKTVIDYKNKKIPFIPQSPYSISISHSGNISGIITGKNIRPGLDIEQLNPRIINISSRFLNDQEYIIPENKILHYTIHWAAKETIYKLFPEDYLNFKQDIWILPFSPQKKGIVKAKTKTSGLTKTIEIQYSIIQNHVISWAYVKPIELNY